MTQPTEKQLAFAKKIGIENPENYTKEALSKLINEKRNKYVQETKNDATISPQSSISNVLIQRTDKPHSFEFGKSTRRHKVFYNTIEELKKQYEELRLAGFIDLEDEITTIKV
jgi:hypothetical protein